MLLLTPFRIAGHNIHHLWRMNTFQVNSIFTVFFKMMPSFPLFFRCSPYFVSSTRKFCYVLRFLFNFQIALLTVATLYKVATKSELVNNEHAPQRHTGLGFCEPLVTSCLPTSSLWTETHLKQGYDEHISILTHPCKHSSFSTDCWFINIELLMPERSLPNTRIFSIGTSQFSLFRSISIELFSTMHYFRKVTNQK